MDKPQKQVNNKNIIFLIPNKNINNIRIRMYAIEKTAIGFGGNPSSTSSVEHL